MTLHKCSINILYITRTRTHTHKHTHMILRMHCVPLVSMCRHVFPCACMCMFLHVCILHADTCGVLQCETRAAQGVSEFSMPTHARLRVCGGSVFVCLVCACPLVCDAYTPTCVPTQKHSLVCLFVCVCVCVCVFFGEWGRIPASPPSYEIDRVFDMRVSDMLTRRCMCLHVCARAPRARACVRVCARECVCASLCVRRARLHLGMPRLHTRMFNTR